MNNEADIYRDLYFEQLKRAEVAEANLENVRKVLRQTRAAYAEIVQLKSLLGLNGTDAELEEWR